MSPNNNNNNNNMNQIIDIINDNLKTLRGEMHSRLDKIEDKIDNVVTQEDCKKNRKSCIEQLTMKRSEISIKRITAIGGVITGTITACAASVVTVLKIFYPEL